MCWRGPQRGTVAGKLRVSFTRTSYLPPANSKLSRLETLITPRKEFLDIPRGRRISHLRIREIPLP